MYGRTHIGTTPKPKITEVGTQGLWKSDGGEGIISLDVHTQVNDVVWSFREIRGEGKRESGGDCGKGE